MREIEWCIKRLKAALADYDVEAMKNYLALLEKWKERFKCQTSKKGP